MSLATELTGFLLCIGSWLLTGASLSNEFWRVSSFAGSVITSTRHYQNLWRSCAESSTGVRNCRDFESMLALPGYIQGCRALMIIALLLGLAAILLAVLGLKCTKLGNTSTEAKAKLAVTAGSIFIMSGLCTLTAVSWYASRIVQEFYDPFFGGTKFELGAGLYLGWAAAALAMLGGGMLCCSFKRSSPSGPPRGNYSYNYSATAPEQKIYRNAPTSETGSSKAYV